MAKKHKFSIEKRDGLFYILDNGTQALTPNGNIVCIKSETLAKLVVKNGNATDGRYDSPTDILCYVYSALDIASQWSMDDCNDIVNQITEWIEGNNDPYLMFRQYTPVWTAIAQSYVSRLSLTLPLLPPHRLMCYVIITSSKYSPMLAQYIVSDIIMGDGEYDQLKETFLDDLKEYSAENGLIFNRRKSSAMIDKFVQYYTSEESSIDDWMK